MVQHLQRMEGVNESNFDEQWFMEISLLFFIYENKEIKLHKY